MTIKPYLQLVRLPNLFTAAADSWAGYLIVGGGLGSGAAWPLVVTSVALYAAGIVLNDLVDLETDRLERPSRPLPSGRVSATTAKAIIAVSLTMGVVAPLFTGHRNTNVVAALLALAVLTYNLGAKRTPWGPWFMGLCRALNLLLGFSIAQNLGGWPCWLAAFAYGTFVAGITWISRSEAAVVERRGLAMGAILQYVGLVGVLVAILVLAGAAQSAIDRAILPIEALLAFGLVALVITRSTGRALGDPRSGTIQTAVKTGIFSLVWLDAALVFSACGFFPGLAVLALWVPAVYLGRWIYST